MRKDHKPYWLKKLQDHYWAAYSRHFLLPQLDYAGHQLQFIGAPYVEFHGHNIHVNDHSHFYATRDKPIRFSIWPDPSPGGQINIGKYTVINPGVRITSASSITVGDNTMLATGVYLSDADWHDLQHRIYAPGNTAPIVLEDNVWIGDNALVTKGVTVGTNSIVGAYSVVTKDVPANTIVAGNPAKIVKRFEDDARFTRREWLFNNQQLPYTQFEDDYWRELLHGNTLLRWAKANYWPGRRD